MFEVLTTPSRFEVLTTPSRIVENVLDLFEVSSTEVRGFIHGSSRFHPRKFEVSSTPHFLKSLYDNAFQGSFMTLTTTNFF